MAKEKFERTKPHCNIGTIGHVDHGKVVLEGHIKHCVRDGIEHGDADKTIESFTKAVERFSNMG